MPQIKSKFTTEERIAFEEKYNLWVYSHEAMIELLMQQDKKIQQLEERLMEVTADWKMVEDLEISVMVEDLEISVKLEIEWDVHEIVFPKSNLELIK